MGFSYWTPLYPTERRTKNRDVYWLCECRCGVRREVIASSFRSGNSRSCGCWEKEKKTKHGDSIIRRKVGEYRSWVGMKSRCLNPNDKDYSAYGGRGITICARWAESYQNFLADMGRKPSNRHSLDRIDTNGNYEPDNCRWATSSQQMNNRRPPSEWVYKRKRRCS